MQKIRPGWGRRLLCTSKSADVKCPFKTVPNVLVHLVYLVHKFVFVDFFFRNDQLGFEYKLDIFNEYARYAEIGIDGAFADVPATYRRALKLLYPEDQEDNEQGENCTNGNSKIPFRTFYTVLLLFMSSFIF